jgi:hypothetical protein
MKKKKKEEKEKIFFLSTPIFLLKNIFVFSKEKGELKKL